MFAVAALAAETERELIRERPLDGLRAALSADQLDFARARQARGECVAGIAAHLGVGRSTLYRALQPAGEG